MRQTPSQPPPLQSVTQQEQSFNVQDQEPESPSDSSIKPSSQEKSDMQMSLKEALKNFQQKEDQPVPLIDYNQPRFTNDMSHSDIHSLERLVEKKKASMNNSGMLIR